MPSTLEHPAAGPAVAGRRWWPAALAVPEVAWAGGAVGLFAVGALLQLSPAPSWMWWAAYLACYVAGGWDPMLAGLQALRKRTLDVDLLMVVAALVAAAIGQVLDGALLIVIFATSGALEAAATKRTRDSVSSLLVLAPPQATRLRDGLESVVDAVALDVDDVVLVRPGERVGTDGHVLDGVSEVDQASITGEPLPVVKRVGAEVFAGTLNGTGALVVRVSRRAEESVIARIVAMVEAASATKARTQLFVEKIEQRYSVAMVAVTVALLTVPLIFGQPLQPTLLRAITFMIVASPCAVVLATMPPLLSAIANAGRCGVLVKSAVVMEQLGEIDTVGFDKTGTLTEGRPRLHTLVLVDGHPWVDADILRWAAAVERPSEHPLAAAVVAGAVARGVQVPEVERFRSTPGRGVQATVDGHVVTVASPALLDELPATAQVEQLHPLVRDAESEGRTAVVVVVDTVPAAVLSLQDVTRRDAALAVSRMRAVTGRTPVLLTGDNAIAAQALARTVGIDEVHAGLLPHDKVGVVTALQSAGRRVLLVGDGVNDAPAMATAHLGMAMGRRGSDLALETADAVIVRDELAVIPTVVELSRRARRVVLANLVIAAAVIVLLVGWDLIGHLPLPLGVAGHEGSTVIVGLNGLRLLRAAAWRRAGSSDLRTLAYRRL